MKAANLKFIFSAIAVLAMLGYSCSKVPITGRRQINLIPGQQMMAMSFQQYSQFLSENKMSTDANATAMVKRVGGRI